MIVAIPARGGSKRIPGKNIRQLGERPLLEYTVLTACAAFPGMPVVVSTEDEAIASIAEAAGARVIRRPAELCSDAAPTEWALLHVLDVLAEEGLAPEHVVCLQPTSPFRRASTLRRVAECVDTPDFDCIMSVTENFGDFWRMSDGQRITRLFPDAPRRQQDREPLFEENSAIYITRVAALRKTHSILGNSVRGIPIDPLEALDINTEFDFRLASAMLAIYPELTQCAAR